jgi:hypothetical protein
MDPNRYMIEIVAPTIGDFETNPTSPRHAFLACVVTFHAIDYLTYPKKAATRRKLFGGESPEFALVDRVAHAFKHVKAGHEESAQRPLNAGDVIVRPPGFWDIAVWDLSRWDDPVGGITIKGEHEHDFLDVVKQAAEFLRTKMRDHVA